MVKKTEFLKLNPDLIVTDGSNQELLLDSVNDHTEYKPLGSIMLCMAKLEREKIFSQYSWGSKDVFTIKKCKSNIITRHSTHVGSTSNYYSFGKQANYGLVDKSSLTQFVHEKFKNMTKMNIAKLNAQLFEQLLAQDIKNGVQSLIYILPNVQEYIAPALNIAYDLQNIIGDCN